MKDQAQYQLSQQVADQKKTPKGGKSISVWQVVNTILACISLAVAFLAYLRSTPNVEGIETWIYHGAEIRFLRQVAVIDDLNGFINNQLEFVGDDQPDRYQPATTSILHRDRGADFPMNFYIVEEGIVRLKNRQTQEVNEFTIRRGEVAGLYFSHYGDLVTVYVLICDIGTNDCYYSQSDPFTSWKAEQAEPGKEG